MPMSLPGTPFCCAQAVIPTSTASKPIRYFMVVSSASYRRVFRVPILLRVSSSVFVLHPAVLADRQTLAVLGELLVALLLGLAGLQALGGIEMGLRHGAVVRHVLLHVRRIVLLLCGRYRP